MVPYRIIRATRVPFGIVVGLKSQGCCKLKRGNMGVPMSDTRYDNNIKALENQTKKGE